ncbi:TPA: hypothetical protein ACU3KO_002910, partial [Staphylococcus aureus]
MKYNNHDKIRDFIIIEAYMFRFKKKVKPEVDMTIKEFILLTYLLVLHLLWWEGKTS